MLDRAKIKKLARTKNYNHIKVSSPVSTRKILNAGVQATNLTAESWDSTKRQILRTASKNSISKKAFFLNAADVFSPKVVESHVAHAEVLKHMAILDDPRRVVKVDPSKYLYTHASIISSVNLEDDEHTIRLASNKDINKNGDAWETKLLLASYKTFVGAYNYLEHVQVPAMKKGWIIDAVPRLASNDDGTKFAVIDILVATERSHKSLIAAIESGELTCLSMGASAKFTICSCCGHVSASEMDVCEHIPNKKLQAYRHTDGSQRFVAELCGSHLDASSNQFEEASWVFDPAFIIAMAKKRIASTKPHEQVIRDILSYKMLLAEEPEDTTPETDLETPIDSPDADFDPESLDEAPDADFSDDTGFDEPAGGDAGLPPMGGGPGPDDFGPDDTDEDTPLEDDTTNIFQILENYEDGQNPFKTETNPIVDKWVNKKRQDLNQVRPRNNVDLNNTLQSV